MKIFEVSCVRRQLISEERFVADSFLIYHLQIAAERIDTFFQRSEAKSRRFVEILRKEPSRSSSDLVVDGFAQVAVLVGASP